LFGSYPLILANPLYIKHFAPSWRLFLPSFTCAQALISIPRPVEPDILDCEIPLPPLEEQRQIAAIARKCDRLRRTRRFTQQLSDTYLQSVFLEMFGNPVTNPKRWKRGRAGEIFEIQLGKMLSEKSKTGENSFPYLANMNVQWGHFDLSEIRTMDFSENEFEKFKLKQGDILVCEGGEVGRTAIWQGQVKNCCYQKALHRLRPIKPVINTSYFLYFMKVGVGLGLIEKVTSLATIAHFTAEKFREFPVLIPPIQLQEKFAKIVQRFERLRIQQREAERQAEHLFQTVLHRAFRGEL